MFVALKLLPIMIKTCGQSPGRALCDKSNCLQIVRTYRKYTQNKQNRATSQVTVAKQIILHVTSHALHDLPDHRSI